MLVLYFREAKYPIGLRLITHAYKVAHPNSKDSIQIKGLKHTESPRLHEYMPNVIDTVQQLEDYRFRFRAYDSSRLEIESGGPENFVYSKDFSHQTKLGALLNETIKSMNLLFYQPDNYQQFFEYSKPEFFFKTISSCGNDAYVDEYSKVLDVYHRLKVNLNRDFSYAKTTAYLVMSPKGVVSSYNFWYFDNVPWPPTMF
ncbi:unnamed protein product [Orchesella dallaii]|uniref:Uncharacterized protein n=1 Tax=Orchesella dallaii TaxID=48710 RepID=A0ABP1Q0G3_9HEXA